VGQSATTPYIDIDNQTGFGPERYIAERGMHTLFADGSENPDGLYGMYEVYVTYQGDFDYRYDDPDSIPLVPWTLNWSYLIYCELPCDDPETEGLWEEGYAQGILGADPVYIDHELNPNANLIEASDNVYIDYREDEITVPESSAVMPP
jgi:hypothetical protein